MKCWQKHAWPFAAVFGAVVIVWLVWPTEPRYGGRTLINWLQILDDPAPAARSQAVRAVETIGTNAVPVLLKLVASSDFSWRSRWQSWVDAFWPFNTQTFWPANSRNELGVRGFAVLGPRASSGIPALAALLHDPARAWFAAQALVELVNAGAGKPALQALIEGTRQPDPTIRHAVVQSMILLHERGGEAVPALARCLSDPNYGVRDLALLALGSIRRNPDVAVPAITRLLGTSQPRQLRIRAILILARFGEKAAPAVPALEKARFDEDSEVAGDARETLHVIGKAQSRLSRFQKKP